MKLKRILRNFLFAVSVLAALLLSPQFARGYDNDTHYWLTYYLAVKAGFSHLQAEQIASANVSVDFDSDTEPVTPDFNNILDAYRFKATFSEVRSKYHALASKEDVNAATKPKIIYWWDPTRPKDAATLTAMKRIVNARKVQFWAETIANKKNPGMFLHYLQDTFAHQDFASFFGHAGYRRVDHMSSDRTKALEMVGATLQYLIAYRRMLVDSVPSSRLKDPENLQIDSYLSSQASAEIIATLEEMFEVNPSVGVQESAITKKWRTLRKDSKTDFSTPSNYLLLAMRKVSKTNTAPDSRRAREVVLKRLGLTSETAPQIWLYDYSRAGVAEPFTSFARVYSKYATPITPSHDYSAKNEANNTKRTLMRDKSPNKRELCMPYRLVNDKQLAAQPCK